MNTPVWNPGTLLELSGSYWQAFTLHTGVKLDLFTLLGDGSMTAGQVAGLLKSDQRGTGLLMNALTAMGLLEKTEETYRSSAAARRFLHRNSEKYIGHMILHHHHLTDTWARMDEAVKSGRPLDSRNSAGQDRRREAFLMGMYVIASQQAPQIASEMDLDNRKSLLDLGGGPGTYAIHFCKHNPKLNAVVYDLPTTQPFAEKTIDAHGLSDRIAFVPGNFVQEEIPGRYDVVWISHILHAESPEVCDRIIEKAVRASASGGLLLIHEFILDNTMDSPLFPALFALNMLQGTDAGQSYSERQLRQMLERAGVSEIRRLDYIGPMESGIMVGVVAG
jgi:hypothetical protein